MRREWSNHESTDARACHYGRLHFKGFCSFQAGDRERVMERETPASREAKRERKGKKKIYTIDDTTHFVYMKNTNMYDVLRRERGVGEMCESNRKSYETFRDRVRQGVYAARPIPRR